MRVKGSARWRAIAKGEEPCRLWKGDVNKGTTKDEKKKGREGICQLNPTLYTKVGDWVRQRGRGENHL